MCQNPERKRTKSFDTFCHLLDLLQRLSTSVLRVHGGLCFQVCLQISFEFVRNFVHLQNSVEIHSVQIELAKNTSTLLSHIWLSDELRTGVLLSPIPIIFSLLFSFARSAWSWMSCDLISILRRRMCSDIPIGLNLTSLHKSCLSSLDFAVAGRRPSCWRPDDSVLSH